MDVNKKKEVLEWIVEAKKKGYSRTQIEEELKKQGCSSDLMDEPSGDSKNNSVGGKNRIIILAILIMLVLSIGGYVLFIKLNAAKNKYEEAKALTEEGKTDDALKIYQEILTEYPNTKWAYFSNYNSGNIYFDSERYESAIPYFEKTTKANHEIACRSNNKLGRIYLDKLDEGMAIKYFSTVLELNKNPENQCPIEAVTNTYLGLGRIYLKQKDYDASLGYLKEAYKSDSNSVYINYYMGMAYYLIGKYDAAKIYLKNSLRLDNQGDIAIAAKKYLKEIQEKEPAQNLEVHTDGNDFSP